MSPDISMIPAKRQAVRNSRMDENGQKHFESSKIYRYHFNKSQEAHLFAN